MSKSNLQVRIDRDVESEMDRVSGKSRSAFIREAIVEKLRRDRSMRLEQEWIQALQKEKGSSKEDGDWLKAEAWEDR